MGSTLPAYAQKFVWARAMGGDGREGASAVAVDASGNVYTVGSFWVTADFDPGPGTFTLTSAGPPDVFVSKLDAAGDFVWARAMGGPAGDDASGVAVDASGNVYIVGYFRETADFDPGPGTFNLSSAGGRDVFVSKLDAAGNFAWARAVGGSGNDEAFGVALDVSGSPHAVGSFEGTVDFEPGPATVNLSSAGSRDAFISRLDPAGNLVWARAFGGPSIDESRGVAVDTAGNVYSAGRFYESADFDPGPATFNLSSAGNEDAFVSKLDAAGIFVWARSMGGPEVDRALGIALDASGNPYSAGSFEGTADFDPGPGTFSLSSAGPGLPDPFVSKLDAAGNLVWARAIGAPGGFQASGVTVDADGNVYSVGIFSTTGDFDPGPGTFNLTSAGQSDVFVSKLDGDGNFLWAGAVGGPHLDSAGEAAVDSSGSLHTVGAFEGPADFDPGPGTFTLSSAGQTDAFVLKLAPVLIVSGGAAKVTPAFTTCQMFRDGKAADLNEVKYVVQDGKISSVSGQLFYYSKVTAASPSFTIDVPQTRGNPAFPFFGVQRAQTSFFNSACTRSIKGALTIAPDGSNVQVTVAGASTGEVFYLAVMYRPATVIGTPVSKPYPTVIYAFETQQNGAVLARSQDSVLLRPA